MGSERSSLSRRKLLAALSTGTMAALAGCSCGTRDDVLRLTVTRLSGTSDGVRGRLRVLNPGPPRTPTDSDREKYATTYLDVTILGYGRDRQKILQVDVGELSPGMVHETGFRADDVPVVLTADAAEVDSNYEESCPTEETGAPVFGYLGRFEGKPSHDGYLNGGDLRQGENGHRWVLLRRHRRMGDDLPPRKALFENLACRQRRWVQSSDHPDPDLSLVPTAAEQASKPIPDPTIHHKFTVIVRRATETERDHEVTEDRTLPLDRFPPMVRAAIRENRGVGWVNREEFFDVVSHVLDESVSSVQNLPSCDLTSVNCRDTRGITCKSGVVRYDGRKGWYLSYFVRHDDTIYLVGMNHEEVWKAPDADPLPPCTDERAEEFSVYAYDEPDRYRGLDTAVNGTAVTDPLREGIRRARETGRHYQTFAPSREEWTAAISALEGLDEPRVPDCSWPNVRCTRTGQVHCGAGSVTAFYRVRVDGEVSWLRLVYEWRRQPATSSSEPKYSYTPGK